MAAYLAIKTPIRGFLIEMKGETKGVKNALASRRGPVSFFDTKPAAMQWLERTGVPEITIGALRTTTTMCCGGGAPMSKKGRIIPK